MPTYAFTLRIIARLEDEALMDAIYGRCPDCSLLVAGDSTLLHFDRSAASLQNAIQSAIQDVNTLGHHVEAVEMEPDTVTTQTA